MAFAGAGGWDFGEGRKEHVDSLTIVLFSFFSLKAIYPEPLLACMGRGGSAGGTGKRQERGTKALLSPKSDPPTLKGHEAIPRA